MKRSSLLLCVIVALGTPGALAQGRADIPRADREVERGTKDPSSRELPYKEGQPIPVGSVLESHPRTWMLVIGTLLFVPSYAFPAYLGVSGEASRYGPVDPESGEALFHFGSGWLLLVPVFGPKLFDASFCSDARARFAEHPRSDEPHDACSDVEIGGLGLSTWFMLVQATGAGLIAGSYLWPSRTLRQTSPNASYGLHGWAVDGWTGNRAGGLTVRARF